MKHEIELAIEDEAVVLKMAESQKVTPDVMLTRMLRTVIAGMAASMLLSEQAVTQLLGTRQIDDASARMMRILQGLCREHFLFF